MRGYNVSLQDVSANILEESLQKVRSNLTFLVHKGALTKDEEDATLKRIYVTLSLKEAVRDADYVQESAAESYEVKKSLFRALDEHAPSNAILASSSSGLLMSEIQKVTLRPGRCVIAHPFNPPHIIPLVEIVPGKQTSQATLEATKKFMISLGKVPVVLKKEIPGYLANRLSAALWREAIDLVCQGIASVGEIDDAVRYGPGLRWAIMGPHLTFHLGGGNAGIEGFVSKLGGTFEVIWESMSTWKRFPPSIMGEIAKQLQTVIASKGLTLRDLANWRDEKLLALLRVIQET
jgi:3-hydroxyacyl-CoA dehydrogenase